jgi:two-component system, chemotaxis family, chemotaxis protein CheY
MGKPGVLIVDDDRSTARALEEILLDEGYQASRASDGAEALALLEMVEPPNLILLDLDMPGMGGVEFRRRQLENARLAEIPVVLLSGNACLGRLSKELGVAAALEKPIRIAELLAILAVLVGAQAPCGRSPATAALNL